MHPGSGPIHGSCEQVWSCVQEGSWVHMAAADDITVLNI